MRDDFVKEVKEKAAKGNLLENTSTTNYIKWLEDKITELMSNSPH